MAGRWLYAGQVLKVVEIVAMDHDYYFDLPALDGREPWERFAPNSDGLLYYVRADGGDLLGCPPFLSVAQAKAWADAQPWAPIAWDG
ncbi:MAG: hypothetical protein EON56_02195 [Alphaproteobacteria bacterium]|nr:MAG: hypothetical protein EON56_02195 [Alphaproteobacteria bacterium]